MAQLYTPPSSSPSTVDSSTWRTLAWLGVGLQALAFVAVWWLQRWNGVWIIGAFLALSFVFMVMQDRLPSLISLVVVLAAVLNSGGWAFDWYDMFVWFDETVHAFTAFAVVAAIMYLLWDWRWIASAPGSGGFVLKAALVGLGLGIAWEILEMMFLNLAPVDTFVDLLMDTIGAAIGGWFAGWAVKEQGATRPA